MEYLRRESATSRCGAPWLAERSSLPRRSSLNRRRSNNRWQRPAPCALAEPESQAASTLRMKYIETAFGQLAFAIKLLQAAEDDLSTSKLI